VLDNLLLLQFSRPFWLSFWMEDGPRKKAIGLRDTAASGLARWVGVFEEVAGVRLMSDEEFPALHCAGGRNAM
jgi:hypothetical protein